MRGQQRGRRRWVTVAGACGAAVVVPGLLISGVCLGVIGVLQDESALSACGVLAAGAATLLERRRVATSDERLVRMRTRLRVTRDRGEVELSALRRQLRSLDLQLWERRLVDEMTPAARDLITGMAATLARPYSHPPVQFQVLGELDTQEWDPAPAPPLQPERPTIELPLIRPGAGALVIDLRSRPAEVDPTGDIAALDELVYQQLARAEPADELTQTMEQPGRRAPSALRAGTAAVPDDPGRRTA